MRLLAAAACLCLGSCRLELGMPAARQTYPEPASPTAQPTQPSGQPVMQAPQSGSEFPWTELAMLVAGGAGLKASEAGYRKIRRPRNPA
jgi:hypothetical protein